MVLLVFGSLQNCYALSEPVPGQDSACRRAGVLQLGGTRPELVESMAAVLAGRPAAKPFVIANQFAEWDPSRAKVGTHTFDAFCLMGLSTVMKTGVD